MKLTTIVAVFFPLFVAARITELDDSCKQLDARVKLLETNYQVLQSNIRENMKTEKLSSEFRENQQMQFDVLSNLIKLQRAWLIEMKELLTEIPDRSTGSSKGETVIERSRPPIAFSAYMDKDMDDIGKDQTIIFNKVLINEGGAYNEHTGVFTCPKDGLYDFSFVIGQRDSKWLWARLFVNSDVLVAAAVDGQHATQDLQGGNRVLARLKEGDVVRVACQDGVHVEGDVNRFTTFSGVFITD